MKETDIAWAAGFTDGEGYVRFANRGINLIIGQRDRNPLDRFVRIFKIGNVRSCQIKYKGEYRTNHVLGYYGEKALFVLGLLLPFLTVKEPAARMAVEQYARVKNQKPVSRLNHRKQVVCLLRNAGHTFGRIGQAFGISRQRAHQLYWTAPESVRTMGNQLRFY